MTLYTTVLSVGVVAALLMGAAANRNANFDTIDVKRINVREPDGTLRMVISDKARRVRWYGN